LPGPPAEHPPAGERRGKTRADLATNEVCVISLTDRTALVTGARRGIGRTVAVELAGTGVTVNAFRPGSVDTAMEAWIRGKDPQRIGAGLHQRFNRSYSEGALITPEESAKSLLAHLLSDATGEI
jgi:NAD(P)-dependent dehydrogenase (short-subunit alcohol dehydrogenase family)